MRKDKLIKDNSIMSRGIPVYIYGTEDNRIGVKFSLHTKNRNIICNLSKKKFKNADHTFFYHIGVVIDIHGPKQWNKIAVGFFLKKIYDFYLTLQDLM